MSPTRPLGPARPLRLAGLLAALAVVTASCALPALDEERESPRQLDQTSFVFASDGTLLTTLHAEQDRVLVRPGRIPQTVKDAVVAIEDQRFWSHRGVDLKALLRAAYLNATEGELIQGGSTITQQYVKNTITGSERTIDRKLKEAILAYQLEKEMPKEVILGNYLNTVYFGQGAYGIKSAAREYFSKPVSALTLRESALLAGLIAGPERWDPVDDPRAALERRNHVLARMHELGMVDTATYARARAQGLGLQLRQERRRYPAPYFVEYVKRQILGDKRFGQTAQQRSDFLFAGGLRIYTTIDLDMQRAAEEAVSGVLSQPGDPYGALTALDPRTGHIKAMVGGRDFFAKPKVEPFAKVNLATGGITGRQAGSAFKPFALVAALESGMSPSQVYPGGSSIVLSDPVCSNAPGDPWVVRNYEGSSYGSLTVEQATIRSVNVVYAQIIRDVGPRRVVEAAERMGIESRLRPFCSAVLGANEVSPLEMASAYGTLATGGTHVAPTAIDRITDASGNVLFQSKADGQEAISPAVAFATTRILQQVIGSGTGVGAQIGRPAAGKTGTAQQWRDAWFVGFIPQLVAGVWVGFPQGQISMVPPTTRIRVTGGSFPAQIWRAFTARVTMGMPVQDFGRPDAQFVAVPIDVTQGCVANELTPPENIRILEFVAGTQPTKKCPRTSLPVPLQVPSVVGMSGSAASALLEQAGFIVILETEYEPYYVPGTVIGQSPEAGTEATTGQTIRIVVATDDPPLEVVPDVVGLGLRRARRI